MLCTEIINMKVKLIFTLLSEINLTCLLVLASIMEKNTNIEIMFFFNLAWLH